MEDLMKAVYRDEQEYLDLCVKHDEPPKHVFNAHGHRILDIYGQHAREIQWREELDKNKKDLMCLIDNCRLRGNLSQAVSLLQALFYLQNGPPLESRKNAWVEVMGQTLMFMRDMERGGIVPTEIKPLKEDD